MSQYTKQDTIEEKGRAVLSNSLDKNFFLLNDFGESSGKDKYPDIDGQIRLRDGDTNYLNRYLHYQLKSHNKIINDKRYYVKRSIIDYLVDTNVPTLFIVVEIETEKVYWIFIDNNQKQILNLDKDQKGRSFNLTTNEIDKHSLELNRTWQKFAKEDDYQKISDSLTKIIQDYHKNLKAVLGLLFLLVKVKKNRLAQIFSDLLDISDQEAVTIINRLQTENVVSDTTNYFLLENEKLGIESLFALIESDLLDFDKLDEIVDNQERRFIFRQLSKIEHSFVVKYLNKYADNLLNYLNEPSSNDEIFESLELLNEYSFRVPVEAAKIIKKVISNKPLKPEEKEMEGWGKIIGKSHDDLILKCIELLGNIRYLKPKETFGLLIKLSSHQNEDINSKAIESLKKLAGFDLFVIKKIGYQPQLFLLNEIKKWKDEELKDNNNLTIEIANKLLTPSYEGTSWKDYQTLTFHSGALPVNENLRKIRESTIEILKKLYSLTEDLKLKQKIIQTLLEATQTPLHSYGKDMEKLVLENTNNLIDYYISIFKEIDNEIAREIEEHIRWFIQRFEKKELPNIEELQSLIFSKDSYQLFRVFVGYDFGFSEETNWKKTKEERKKKIQEFIYDISKENLSEWTTKILSVIKNYSISEDKGQFQHLNIFLYELGKQKPEIAHEIVIQEGKKLESFLIHLVAGIWNSERKKIAKDLIKEWIDKEKYLSICASVFNYVGEIDKVLLDNIFKKAKEKADINTLNNIIIAVVTNYPKYKNIKTLFVNSIKELTKQENCQWISFVWFRKESVLNDLTAGDFNIVLENLLLTPNIDYQIEEILKPIAEIYPKKTIDYFRKRISIQAKKEKVDRYDAVPFNLHKLNESLAKHANVIIEEILRWFIEKDWLLYWEGRHLLQAIFSGFNDILEKKLIDLLKSKKKNRTEVVLSILRAYKGEEFLHNICKEFIRQYPKNDKYHQKLFIVLSKMGIVGGEYGFVEGYKKKKESVQSWKEDKKKAIQNFIKKYEEYLDKQIIYEKKRADEDIELRKREFES